MLLFTRYFGFESVLGFVTTHTIRGLGLGHVLVGFRPCFGGYSIQNAIVGAIIASHVFLIIAIASSIPCQRGAGRMQIIATSHISRNFLLPQLWCTWLAYKYRFQVATTGGQVQLQYATSPSSQHRWNLVNLLSTACKHKNVWFSLQLMFSAELEVPSPTLATSFSCQRSSLLVPAHLVSCHLRNITSRLQPPEMSQFLTFQVYLYWRDPVLRSQVLGTLAMDFNLLR